MTVAVLDETMSADEFRRWAAFYEIEPWGSEIEFYRAGIIASTVANTSMLRSKDSKILSPMDFMPVPSGKEKTRGSKPIRDDLRSAFADKLKFVKGDQSD